MQNLNLTAITMRVLALMILFLGQSVMHGNVAYGQADIGGGISGSLGGGDTETTCFIEIAGYTAPAACKVVVPLLVATGFGLGVKALVDFVKSVKKANREQRIANEQRASESRRILSALSCQKIQEMPEGIRALHSFNLLKTNPKSRNDVDRDAIIRIYGCLAPQQLRATWGKRIMTEGKNRNGTWGKWIQKKLTKNQAMALRDILLDAGMNPQTEFKKSTLKLIRD